MKKQLLITLTAGLLFLIPTMTFAQAPNLGTASNFALFTAAGAFNELGSASTVTGDVGTAVGAFNLFPPGTLTGNQHVADPIAIQAGTDVLAAYSSMSGLTCDAGHGVLFGGGEILPPGIYCIGAASTLTGTLTLDGGGNPDAIFIFKIGGAFATAAGSNIVLTGSANLCNVYWQVNGQADLGAGSSFMGNILANGAINLLAGATLQGRALSTAGAISLYDNTVSITCVTAPAAIPTLSEWGLIFLGLALLAAGTFYITRMRG